MKKHFFFMSLVAASMLTACSSDDNVSEAVDNNITSEVIDDTKPVAIKLGVTADAVVSTRGTGTVGGIDISENVWNGQPVYVAMFQQPGADGKLKYSLGAEDANGDEVEVFKYKKFWTPGSANISGAGTPQNPDDVSVASGIAWTADGSVNYYPFTGNHDFVAFHIGNLGNENPAVNEYSVTVADDSTSHSISLTIDGTQDIMVANAVVAPNAVSQDKFPEVASNEIDNIKNKLYSAYAARRNAQPTLTFSHLLSRLQFHIAAGNKKAAKQGVEDHTTLAKEKNELTDTTGLFVDTIKVLSVEKCDLVVAKVSDGHVVPGELTFSTAPEDLVYFRLMEEKKGATSLDTLVAYTPVVPTWNSSTDKADTVAIGAPMLLQPGVTKYNIEICVAQVVMTNRGNGTTDPTYEVRRNKVPATIELGNSKTFEAGSSYNVKIIVYGYEKIEVKTTLTAWKQGDSIVMNPMDN